MKRRALHRRHQGAASQPSWRDTATRGPRARTRGGRRLPGVSVHVFSSDWKSSSSQLSVHSDVLSCDGLQLKSATAWGQENPCVSGRAVYECAHCCRCVGCEHGRVRSGWITDGQRDGCATTRTQTAFPQQRHGKFSDCTLCPSRRNSSKIGRSD